MHLVPGKNCETILLVNETYSNTFEYDSSRRRFLFQRVSFFGSFSWLRVRVYFEIPRTTNDANEQRVVTSLKVSQCEER